MQELTQAVTALRGEQGLLGITLTSIGGGVMVTNAPGRVIFFISVAESLTEWTTAKAKRERLGKVFNIIGENSRQPGDTGFTGPHCDGEATEEAGAKPFLSLFDS